MERALDGLRVIDFGQYIAGPLAGMLLADQGAEVIRVDPPGGPRWDTPANMTWNRGKKSIVLNLKDPRDAATAKKLVQSADVIIENFRPGVMDRLGLGYSAFQERKSLIYCSMPGYGKDHPSEKQQAWEGTISADAGLYWPANVPITRGFTKQPKFSALPIPSVFAAYQSVCAITMALCERERSGLGQFIEVPLYDSCFSVYGLSALEFQDPRHHVPFSPTPWLEAYKCSDGRWLQIHFDPKDREKFLKAAKGDALIAKGLHKGGVLLTVPGAMAELKKGLSELFASKPAVEWEHLIHQFKGAAAATCLTSEEWMLHPHALQAKIVEYVECPVLGKTLQVGVNPKLSLNSGWISGPYSKPDSDRESILRELEELRPSSQASNDVKALGARALAGLKVLDVTSVIAGPVAARTLAEYGAEVVRIDQPTPDEFGRLVNYFDVNRGKKSAQVDLKTEDGLKLFWKLAEKSDVILQNFSPGVAERLGIGYEDVSRKLPHVVYGSLNACGSGGSLGDRRGWEDIGQALTGMRLRQGGGVPEHQSFFVNDYSTGLMAAFAVGLALFAKRKTGKGQLAHTSLAMTATTTQSLMCQIFKGKVWDEPKGPEAMGYGPLQRLYLASDGWMFVGVDPKTPALLNKVEGLENIDTKDSVRMEKNLAEILAQIPVGTWTSRFAKADATVAAVQSSEQPMLSAWAIERGLSVRKYHPGYGMIRTTGPVAQLSRTPVTAGTPAEPSGRGFAEILTQAGVDASKYLALFPQAKTIPELQSVADILKWIATHQPQMPAFLELDESCSETQRLSFGEFYARVTATANSLSGSFAKGDRIVIAIPTSVDFAVAFFACLQARMVAVPLVPDFHNARELASIKQIIGVCQPKAIFCRKPNEIESISELKGLKAIKVEGGVQQDSSSAAPVQLQRDDVACILFTSGSTGLPKGVTYLNGDLLTTCDRVKRRCSYSWKSVALSWQSVAHITGLISAVCEPIFAGCLSIILPTDAFGGDPFKWLQTISKHKVTHSGGPSFAYEQCAKAVTPERLKDLNLETWQVAFVAADAVRAKILHDFSEAFKAVKFLKTAFQACYGQSEAFRVATSPVGRAPTSIKVLRNSLENGLAVPCEPTNENGAEFVGHGPMSDGIIRLEIVDATTRTPCKPFEVGEIWISGEGTAQGYWNSPEVTAQTFGAKLAHDDGRFYIRSGDLGFTDGKDLFIVGRLKDLIIIRGKNLYPLDIETSVSTVGLNVGSSAAFSTDDGKEERLTILVEINKTDSLDANQYRTLISEIRRCVSTDHGIYPHEILFLKQGDLNRTHSGKVSRSACRTAYLAGKIRQLPHEDTLLGAADQTAPTTELESVILQIWLKVLGLQQIGIHQSLFDLGVDSLLSLQLSSRVRSLGYEISPALLLQNPTIASLAAVLKGQNPKAARASNSFTGEVPLLPTQAVILKAFDTIQTGPEDGGLVFLTIPKSYKVIPRLDLSALEQAVVELRRKHDGIRAQFKKENGQWIQTIRPPVNDAKLRVFDSEGKTEAEILEWFKSQWLNWNIFEDDLFRVAVVHLADCTVISTICHHLISDNITEFLLADDLFSALDQACSRVELHLPEPSARIEEWANWLHKEKAKGLEKTEEAYWLEEISARTLARKQSSVGGQIEKPWYELKSVDSAAITRASKKLGASFFEIYLAALFRVFSPVAGEKLRIDIAHNGRPSLPNAFDISRMAGLMHFDIPITAYISDGSSGMSSVELIKQKLRNLPKGGIGYALMRAFSQQEPWTSRGQIAFNYQKLVPPHRETLGSAHFAPFAEFHTKVSKIAGPALINSFSEAYYGDQMRWYFTEYQNFRFCSIYCPPESFASGQVSELFKSFERELNFIIGDAQ